MARRAWNSIRAEYRRTFPHQVRLANAGDWRSPHTNQALRELGTERYHWWAEGNDVQGTNVSVWASRMRQMPPPSRLGRSPAGSTGACRRRRSSSGLRVPLRRRAALALPPNGSVSIPAGASLVAAVLAQTDRVIAAERHPARESASSAARAASSDPTSSRTDTSWIDTAP
jgi:hypothetical protein